MSLPVFNRKGLFISTNMNMPAIEITQVTKHFGSGKKKKQILSDLSLRVRMHSVYGFLGPNGAGKSTTIKLLLGFLRADSGSLRILGNQVGQDEFRKPIGYLPEFPFFYDHLTARETLLLSGKLSHVQSATLKKRIPLVLQQVHLEQAQHQRIGSFSKGMKQRLGLANALIHDPQLLIFDEPMSGLDPLGRHLVKQLIHDLREQGKTIFFSSHILGDIEELCDDIGIIHKGRLLFSGGLAQFMDSNQNATLEEGFVTLIEEVDNAPY